MEHGNMGFQVAPESNKPTITEGEVETVRNIFEKMADTIVGAASLSKEVEALRRQVDQISADLSSARERNQDLDHILTVTRQDRDELRGQLHKANETVEEANREVNSLKREVEDLRRRNEVQSNTIRDQIEELNNAKKDRDEAIMEGLQKDEKIKEYEKTIVSIGAQFSDMAKMFQKVADVAPQPTADPTGFGSDRPAFLDKPVPQREPEPFSHEHAEQYSGKEPKSFNDPNNFEYNR